MRPDVGDMSMFAIATLLLRNWRRVMWLTVAGAVFALASVISRPALYKAMASFAPEASEASRSGLTSLAGQFGVSLPAGGQTLSPDYYAKLLVSRTLLRRLAVDTFVIEEMGGKRVSFFDLFEIQGTNQTLREDLAVAQLTKMVGTSVSKTTGIVEVTVRTKWRSVSLALVTALVDGVNEFNTQSRQTQAGTERLFVEGRLAVADSDLRSAEERLGQFVRSNRQFSGSSELTLQRDRLERQVSQKQQLYTTLSQSYEQARIREVRDTPVITVVEAPAVPSWPEPRGRTQVVLLGIMVGGIAGLILVFMDDAFSRRRAHGDPDASEFMVALRSAAGPLFALFQRLSGRRTTTPFSVRTPPDAGPGT